MAKIRSKQLADFVSSYSGLTASTDILNAAAVSTMVAAVNSDATASINSLEGDVASIDTRFGLAEGDISSLQGDVTSIDTRFGLAEGDISSLQGDVTSIDTRIGLAEGDISSLQGDVTSIDTRFGSADTRMGAIETNVSNEVASIDTRVGLLETELSNEVSSIDTRFGSADTRMGAIETNVSNEVASIDTRITAVESVNTVQGTAIASLEAAILEDFEFLTEKFSGNPANTYALTSNVQDNNENLVWVTINGHDVSIALTGAIGGVSGNAVTLDPALIGYAIDSNDEVVIRYQKD